MSGGQLFAVASRPVLEAIEVADRACSPVGVVAYTAASDHWMSAFAEALADVGLTITEATPQVLRLHGKQRVTHGRHCTCSPCAREEWPRITSPCGMHGGECPRVYAPLGVAGDIVPTSATRDSGAPQDPDSGLSGGLGDTP